MESWKLAFFRTGLEVRLRVAKWVVGWMKAVLKRERLQGASCLTFLLARELIGAGDPWLSAFIQASWGDHGVEVGKRGKSGTPSAIISLQRIPEALWSSRFLSQMRDSVRHIDGVEMVPNFGWFFFTWEPFVRIRISNDLVIGLLCNIWDFLLNIIHWSAIIVTIRSLYRGIEGYSNFIKIVKFICFYYI